MIVFAFLLIFLGVGFILFGNYFSLDEKESSKKWNLRRYIEKQFFHSNSRKKSRFQGEIRKRIFNKKYPEKELDPEIESLIKQERELDTQLPFEPSGQVRTPEREPDLKDLETSTPSPSQPQVLVEVPKSPINDTKAKEGVIVLGTLYLDYGKEISMDTKNIHEIDPEESIFQHFRRIGKAELQEKEGRILYRNQESLFEFPIFELEKIVFYENAITMFPSARDLPNFLFFTKEIGPIKERIREDLREN